jgi:hypothetical protein
MHTQCVYVLGIILRISSHYFPERHQSVGLGCAVNFLEPGTEKKRKKKRYLDEFQV